MPKDSMRDYGSCQDCHKDFNVGDDAIEVILHRVFQSQGYASSGELGRVHVCVPCFNSMNHTTLMKQLNR